MTQEEKAKAYDRVSKEVKDFFEGRQKMYSDVNQTLEYLFPELAESEDERISKRISQSLHGYLLNSDEIIQADAWLKKQGEKHPDPYNGVSFEYNGHIWGMCARDNGVDISCDKHLIKHFENQTEQEKDILEDAILDGNEDGLIAETIRYKHEKQSKQKLDKVEPKFKVGDWIINPRTGLIKHIKNVLLCDNNGNYEFESSSMSIDSVDNSFRLWTIEDAKDGDILYHSDTASNGIFIFKELLEYEFGKKVICYCDYDSEDGFCLGESHTCCWANAKILHPATKEQRDLLFQKMNEAGYTFDFEKKELKKIEQNSTWSEEDESIIEEVVSYLINYSNIVSKEDVDRIEYLINKIQDICPHQKQKWSDVDKDMLFRIIDDLKFLKDIISIDPKYAVNITDVEREITWLKSLRPQNKWKPSDEQMEALDWQVENTSVSSWQYKATKELMEDLKKLKG